MPHIVISGGGASGLFLAILLSQQSPNTRITIFEKQKEYVSSPKAYAYLPVLFPAFKSSGIWDALIAATEGHCDTGIFFRQVSDKDKKIVYQMPKQPGSMGPILLSQGKYMGVVVSHIKENCKNVDLRMGAEVVDYVQQLGPEGVKGVRVRVANSSGDEEVLQADYLIGADGSKSAVRKLAGISLSGVILPKQLVSCDVYYPFDKFGWNGGCFLIDDKYFGHIGAIDNKGLWRVSFAIDDLEASIEDIHKIIPEWFDAMFPGPKPLKYTIDKSAGYPAAQLVADTYLKGRVILIGDAAHLTNPYIGLGLGTGLLDALALAPVLTGLFNGTAEPSLLKSWASARRDVFRNFVDPTSRAAFASVQDANIETFPERHPILKKALGAMKRGEAIGLPPVVTDVRKLKGWVEPGSPVVNGGMSVEPRAVMA